MKLSIFVIALLVFGDCSEEKVKPNELKVALYESYNLIEIYPKLLKIDSIIRKTQLDSISKNSDNSSRLGTKNQNNNPNATQNNYFENYPFFQVFTPNTKFGKDGNGYLDTSTMLGVAIDSIKLRQYLAQVDYLFQNEIEWRITGRLASSMKCLHAFKQNKNVIQLNDSDIDSVIVLKSLIGMMGKVVEKIADLNNIESDFGIILKLNKELANQLTNKNYTLLFKTMNHEYSGSIINFKGNPDQYIEIGEMDKEDFKFIRKKFENRIILK